MKEEYVSVLSTLLLSMNALQHFGHIFFFRSFVELQTGQFFIRHLWHANFSDFFGPRHAGHVRGLKENLMSIRRDILNIFFWEHKKIFFLVKKWKEKIQNVLTRNATDLLLVFSVTNAYRKNTAESNVENAIFQTIRNAVKVPDKDPLQCRTNSHSKSPK
jgi:hypothetical protein